jgi:hypothetical protein
MIKARKLEGLKDKKKICSRELSHDPIENPDDFRIFQENFQRQNLSGDFLSSRIRHDTS